MSDPVITHNESERRYEAAIDGKLAGYATYQLGQGTVTFPHTLVLPEHEGKGVAGAIARYSLDDVRSRGERKVVPACSYYAHFMEKHKDEYGDLLEG